MIEGRLEDDRADLEFKPSRVATLQKVGVNFMDVAAPQKVKDGTIFGVYNYRHTEPWDLPFIPTVSTFQRVDAYLPMTLLENSFWEPFSEDNNNPLKVFAMDFILGNSIILEYFCPKTYLEDLILRSQKSFMVIKTWATNSALELPVWVT